jgi:subtilisin family serine protease
MRTATIVATVVAASVASGSSALAGAADRPFLLSPQGQAGFCVPSPGGGDAMAAAVGALDVSVATTRPIAVLDTGVDGSVPELAGRVLPEVDALGGGPGGDPDGHGTQVAAIAAGTPGQMRGVSPTSPILPVRIFDAAGASSVGAVVQGIKAAVAQGAGVINISGAAKVADTSKADILRLSQAITEAFAKGVLVVAAPGNDGELTETVPASLPHVLVAGSATNGARSVFSNLGPWVDLVTPADNFFAPLPAGLCIYGYGSATGTSYAAPALAGAAAIVQQLRPELTTQQKFELLRRSATDLPPEGRDDQTGFGMLNLAAAITATPLAKDSSPEPDDDPLWVKKPYARSHPVRLKKSKRWKASGSVNPAKDPSDVYPVALKKSMRLVVRATASDPGALLEMSIFGPRAASLAVFNGSNSQRLLATGGLSPGPDLDFRAKKAGTYYVVIETSDPTDTEDTDTAIPDTQPYRISAFTQQPKKRKKR